MAKKSKMQEEVEKGEQLDLIDIQPKNAKAIVSVVRRYKEFQAARLAALRGEVEQKQRVLELVRVAGLQRLEGGKIRFESDNAIITITPQDELIKIKEKAKAKK